MGARKRVRTFKGEAKQNERDVKSIRKELNPFRNYAMAAFGELQKHLEPLTSENSVAAKTVVTEAPLSQDSSGNLSVHWPPSAVVQARLSENAAEPVMTTNKVVTDSLMTNSPSSFAAPSAIWPAAAIITTRVSPSEQGAVREPSMSAASSAIWPATAIITTRASPSREGAVREPSMSDVPTLAQETIS